MVKYQNKVQQDFLFIHRYKKMFMSFQRYKYDISYHNLSIIAIFFFPFYVYVKII